MSTFKVVFLLLLMAPLFSYAYECRGVTRKGAPVYVNTQRVYQDNIAGVRVDIGTQSNVTAASVVKQLVSTIGHSRCPGTWTEIKISPVYSNVVFENLSIRVNEIFYGCGHRPVDTISVQLSGVSELIALSCKE